MFKMVEEGDYDMVVGEWAKCKDGWIFCKILSMIVNFIICNFFGVYLKDYGCVFWVFWFEIVKDMGIYGEFYCFILVLAYLEGVCII